MKDIPLDHISPWARNPRVKSDPAHIRDLESSIVEQGLLQNLVVVPDPAADGMFIQIAGASRYQALKNLAEKGKIAADMGIPCEVREIDPNDPAALEVALSENIIRRQMDAIDESIAMAELARSGRTAEAIAATFGYKVRLVKERMALGRLVPEAQEVVRSSQRDLDWARAMTLADVATQNKICDDIKVNPAAWKDGTEVRRFLTAETIPAENALFDVKAYKGRIVHDMFDGDKLGDRAEFWELQNAAIEAMRGEFVAEGWAGVHVTHNPVDLWRYRKTEDMAEGHVLIEVSPNGKVTLHKGLVDPEAETKNNGSGFDDFDLDDVPEESSEGDLVGDAVRVTSSISEYAAAQRSAMVQAAVAKNFRASLEATVAGLIGHGEIAIRAHDYRFGGSADARTSTAFEEVAQIREDISDTLMAAGIPATDRDDAEILAMIRSMTDEALQDLFTKLVAMKLGQANTKKLDAGAGSLLNSFGQSLGLDVRANWVPDEHFFTLMQASDLRRMAMEFLPADRQGGTLSAKKPQLVRMLSDAFSDADANDGSIDPETARRLNAWVPGVMRFPAEDDATRLVEVDAESAEGDAFAALFGDAEADTAADVLDPQVA